MSSIALTANFSVATGDFPCRGKTHCALNATHRCAVIHKTRGLRENYITMQIKQSCSPVCTQSGLFRLCSIKLCGSENVSFQTPKSSGCRPNLREWWVGEKISLDNDKGDGIVVGRRQSKKTMRRSLLPLKRFRGRMSGSHFCHGVPAQRKEF